MNRWEMMKWMAFTGSLKWHLTCISGVVVQSSRDVSPSWSLVSMPKNITRLLSLQKIPKPCGSLGCPIWGLRFVSLNGGKFSAPSKPNGFDSTKVMFATRRSFLRVELRWVGLGEFLYDKRYETWWI